MQKQRSKYNANRFDHIIGNIPFGERTLETAFMDMPDEKSLDRYFISRSLDNLKPGGTMALIAHPGALANKSNAAWRLSVNRKARFMGAVKLNAHSFNHAHTAVQQDILLFKKHPEGIEQCLQAFSVEDMEKSEYAQDVWINGTYFSIRQQHVMGIVQHGKGQWDSDVVSGSVTPETLKSILAAFEPEPPVPEGEYDKLLRAAPPPSKM
jgi:type I restriction-modification system DNA methylase subunit